MKFYEFNDCEYYALICAKSEDDAMTHYEEVVSDLEESDLAPNELTEEKVREKIAKNLGDNSSEYKESIKFLEDGIKNEITSVILIDSTLID